MNAVESHFASNPSQVRNNAAATVEEMSLTLLIPIVLVAPWAVAVAWMLTRAERLTEPPPSYFELAKQRLSVR